MSFSRVFAPVKLPVAILGTVTFTGFSSALLVLAEENVTVSLRISYAAVSLLSAVVCVSGGDVVSEVSSEISDEVSAEISEEVSVVTSLSDMLSSETGYSSVSISRAVVSSIISVADASAEVKAASDKTSLLSASPHEHKRSAAASTAIFFTCILTAPPLKSSDTA